MKMIITLYGCYKYFQGLADRDCLTSTVSIRCRFVDAVIKNNLGNPSPIPDKDLIISEEIVPIERLYFADLMILLEGVENPLEDQICHSTTAEIGTLWNEFVRSFIDSGAFVGVRLTCGIKQFRWSPEGRFFKS